MSEVMKGVYLTGHGDFDKLEYRNDIPKPVPNADEVLVKIGAVAVNNTDINTRVGWYSKANTGDTASVSSSENSSTADSDDASWGGAALSFPRIQGIDIAGEIVAVGSDIDTKRVGSRVLVAPCLPGDTINETRFVGSELDGGFAEYVVIPSIHVLDINSDMTDAELASFPCSYTTAENMLERAKVSSGENVLITGASGGVGSAAVQLAKRRGAHVIAVAGAAKKEEVMDAGATEFFNRGTNLVEALGTEVVDVVIDVVGGDNWPDLLEILKRKGRYAVAGAIAGPMVELDLRTLYLKDLTLIGATALEDCVFPNLVSYIEQREIKPLVAKEYPLSDIVQAQKDFLEKKHTGKLVLIP
ncbi:alcohol dehydrogenase family protein [Curvivirga sp.]|uniref:alcohol dehydrogenase family protein n=1 Tax=Curvivirga sp. TaxID=2856848 RepID=UPI003B59CAC9